ncbi:glycosyltransferase family 4 protein [Candidatus Azambacteria bacterium]|nr:glycosyltransferase family 4 protein [Candidatus Azambacteria bacterium]
MKIAYLIESCIISGGNRVIFEHVHRLSERGNQVEIFSERLPIKNEPVLSYRIPIRHKNEATSSEFDVLIISEPGLIFWALDNVKSKKCFFLAQHDIEWMAEVNGERELAEARNILFRSFPSTCLILAVSSWLTDVFRIKYGISPILIPNGVNTELFSEKEPLVRLHNKPSLLLMYDPQIWKGFGDGIVAVDMVKAEIPELEIMIMGKSMPTYSMPLPETSSWSFPWPVTFFSRPDQKNLSRIYSSASVFLSSSWLEGFGLPGLEAMACGVPVVTTDSGGVREYAIHEETAVVVPPRNPRALADAVVRILNDKPLKQKLIKNGLEKIKEFDWGGTIDILEKTFKE